MNMFMDDVRYPPTGFTLVRTIEAAKQYLALGVVERCSLDHDMGACPECVAAGKHIGDMQSPSTTYVNWCSHADDGTKLVRWMIETGHWPKQVPTVHSANPVGRLRMQQLIDTFFGRPAMGAMF